MTMHRRGSVMLFTAVVALTAGCAGQRRPAPAPVPAAPSSGAAAAAAPALRDTHERLHGVLWMQTAAEFWALSQTAYQRAGDTLDRALADATWTAATEQEQRGNYAALPPAIVMDLDETVLDNSELQGQLVLDRTDYLPATWSKWVSRASATAIPGAVEFIKLARSKQIRVLFITNRTAAEEADTIRNLDALLGAATPADDVLCSGENGWVSDKTVRRTVVAGRFRILLLVGDDLNDFISTAGSTSPSARLAVARQHAARWRDRWVLIPNPIYGSWERSLYPKITDDPAILQKKRDTVRGFTDRP